MRFVLRTEQSFRFAPVTRSKRALFARIVFLPIEFAVPPAIQSILLLHVHLHVEEDARAKVFSLKSSGGVVAEFARIVPFALDLLAILLAFGLFIDLPEGEAPRCETLKVWLLR